jgi:hypothetical protein
MTCGDLFSHFGQTRVTIDAMFGEVLKVCNTPLEIDDHKNALYEAQNFIDRV